MIVAAYSVLLADWVPPLPAPTAGAMREVLGWYAGTYLVLGILLMGAIARW